MNIIELLSPNEQKLLKTISLTKGEVLFNEGDICNGVAIVHKGSITISSYSYSGKEIIYNTIKENEMFGNNLVFSSEPRYKGNVIANEKTTLFYIKKLDLIEILQNNRQFLVNYLEIQSNFGKQLNSRIKLLSFDSIEERFLYYLYINNNKIVYSSITDLAKTLSMSREATSRLITNLISKGTIVRIGKVIKLAKMQ